MYGAVVPFAQRMMQILGPRGMQAWQAAQRGAAKGGELMESGIPGRFRDATPKLLTGPAGAVAARGAQTLQNEIPTQNFDSTGAGLTAVTGLLGATQPKNAGLPGPGPKNIPAGVNAPINGADGMTVPQDKSGAPIPMNQMGGNYNDMDNVPWQPPADAAVPVPARMQQPNASSQAQRGRPAMPPGHMVTGMNEDQMRQLMGGLEGAPAQQGPMNPMPGDLAASGLTDEELKRLLGGLL